MGRPSSLASLDYFTDRRRIQHSLKRGKILSWSRLRAILFCTCLILFARAIAGYGEVMGHATVHCPLLANDHRYLPVALIHEAKIAELRRRIWEEEQSASIVNAASKSPGGKRQARVDADTTPVYASTTDDTDFDHDTNQIGTRSNTDTRAESVDAAGQNTDEPGIVDGSNVWQPIRRNQEGEETSSAAQDPASPSSLPSDSEATLQ